jgi:two-component system, cell cycle sensor histidine kinase and response regulator CckA
MKKPAEPASESSQTSLLGNQPANKQVGPLFKNISYMVFFCSLFTITARIALDHDIIHRLTKDCLIFLIWSLPLSVLTFYTLKSSIDSRIKSFTVILTSIIICDRFLDITEEIRSLDQIFLLGRQSFLHDEIHYILAIALISTFIYLIYVCIITLAETSQKLEANQLVIREEIRQKEIAQKSFSESETLLKTIFDTAEDFIFIKDRNGRYVAGNPAMARMINKSPSDFIGKSYNDFIESPSCLEVVEFDDNEVLKGNKIERETTCNVLGVEKIASTLKVPIVEEDGSISGICGIGRDVTLRRKEEKQKKILEKRMLQSQKLESLGIISGGIAHDFNNLLVGILGNASLIQMEENLPESCHNNAEDIISSAEKASEFCDQLLTYSGKGHFNLEPTSLNDSISEILKIMEKVISKKVSLITNLESGLPNIKSNSSQIQQIIMNLITNASESFGEEEGTITIKTGKMHASKEYVDSSYLQDDLPAGEYLYVDVIDTGCGMDKESITQLFDPFFSTKFAGRGLGMTTTLGIVRSHQGAIFVESNPGEGTLFRILFPVTNQPVNKKSSPKKDHNFGNDPGTILVIDDVEAVLNVTRIALELENFKVLTAKDGQEGLEVIKKQHEEISLILLDLTMPKLNGKELIDYLTLTHSEIPIILSSGYDSEEVLTEKTMQAIAGFLKKPYTVQGLLHEVHQALKITSIV